MKNGFDIHWIVGEDYVLLPVNHLEHLPNVGDEIRASRRSFFKVVKRVWCLDEPRTLGQRVNIQLEKVKL